MDGNINFIGSLSGSIDEGGGGGGGSTVTITPTYSSGTKLADYTIDETSGAIFVDLSNYPTNEEIASNHFTKSEVNTMLLADRQYEDLTFQRRDEMSSYQPKLTAGANISIDANNIISASGGSWNYSTSEVNTGQKWIDKKDIYCCVIDNINDNNWHNIASLNIGELLPTTNGYFITNNQYYHFNLYAESQYASYMQYNYTNKTLLLNVIGWTTTKRLAILFYTKSV